ncbi:MAG: hypothetical protein K0S34_1213 [Bacillales bacterium]|nr:hypothetical protein [Bacillales bacterium]
MVINLIAVHWIYLVFIALVIGFLIMRRDTSLVCIIGIFIIALTATASLSSSVSVLFNSFIYAITELLPTILIISIIVAMSKVLADTGVNDSMIKPFTKLIRTPALAYWVIGIVMMVISWFFWPSPAVALIGAVMLPVAFYLLKRDMKNNVFTENDYVIKDGHIAPKEHLLSKKLKTVFAILIPIFFAIDVYLMFKLNLQGGDATALVGGTALIILLGLTMIGHKNKGLEETTKYLIEGFTFGFKVFGPVIPIAAFFYLGDSGFTKIIGEFLPKNSAGIVNDLGFALAHVVPVNAPIAAVTLTSVGAITGLDGSGFSGISLAGSVATLFASAIGHGAATLTALGQIAAIWVGGGTLIPWALIPAAAICGVDPFELARRNLVPVVFGFIVTTIVAMFLI